MIVVLLFLNFFLFDSKIVRWKGFELYNCKLINLYTIECTVLINSVKIPNQLSYHLKHGTFTSSRDIIVNKETIFQIKDNDEFMEYKIIGITDWIEEPQIKWEGFKDLKNYLTN
jgi:hypothetical protein